MTTLRTVLSTMGIDRLDLELLTAHAIRKDRSFVLAHPEYRLSEKEARKLKRLIARRKHHEPVAYLIGEKEFYGLSFFVNQHTLIPRPETELLVEEVLDQISNYKSQITNKVAVVDVGTGSGCIIISIVKHLLDSNNKLQITNFKFFATDISSGALRVARKNAQRHGVQKLISFSASDLLSQVVKKLHSCDEIILLANLPYLSSTLYRESPPDVNKFEPKGALVSGSEGLDQYRRLFAQVKHLLRGKKIHFFLEISPEQASSLDFLPAPKQILPDLAGRPRLVCGTFN